MKDIVNLKPIFFPDLRLVFTLLVFTIGTHMHDNCRYIIQELLYLPKNVQWFMKYHTRCIVIIACASYLLQEIRALDVGEFRRRVDFHFLYGPLKRQKKNPCKKSVHHGRETTVKIYFCGQLINVILHDFRRWSFVVLMSVLFFTNK